METRTKQPLSLRHAARLLTTLIHPPVQLVKHVEELSTLEVETELLRIFDAILFEAIHSQASAQAPAAPPAEEPAQPAPEATETRYDNSVLDGLRAASELGIEAGNMPLPQLLSQALRHAVNQIREERESNLAELAGLIAEMQRYSFGEPSNGAARDLCVAAVQSARINRKALYSASHPVVNVEV